ncbi:Aste57867_1067 [Aphanomyces stellatus]|uniref:Aste57867_1067 protein n=1 Tax=Aphanomyces stellatus TaxID=120398 RepID=A0A485K8E4_9STRA|nr:hypothetical protein As57867_001066 [Aphanomyces stellatus]VFT78289.1 Aste57867_1067 [Aphanomyces stellatus]
MFCHRRSSGQSIETSLKTDYSVHYFGFVVPIIMPPSYLVICNNGACIRHDELRERLRKALQCFNDAIESTPDVWDPIQCNYMETVLICTIQDATEDLRALNIEDAVKTLHSLKTRFEVCGVKEIGTLFRKLFFAIDTFRLFANPTSLQQEGDGSGPPNFYNVDQHFRQHWKTHCTLAMHVIAHYIAWIHKQLRVKHVNVKIEKQKQKTTDATIALCDATPPDLALSIAPPNYMIISNGGKCIRDDHRRESFCNALEAFQGAIASPSTTVWDIKRRKYMETVLICIVEDATSIDSPLDIHKAVAKLYKLKDSVECGSYEIRTVFAKFFRQIDSFRVFSNTASHHQQGEPRGPPTSDEVDEHFGLNWKIHWGFAMHTIVHYIEWIHKKLDEMETMQEPSSANTEATGYVEPSELEVKVAAELELNKRRPWELCMCSNTRCDKPHSNETMNIIGICRRIANPRWKKEKCCFKICKKMAPMCPYRHDGESAQQIQHIEMMEKELGARLIFHSDGETATVVFCSRGKVTIKAPKDLSNEY